LSTTRAAPFGAALGVNEVCAQAGDMASNVTSRIFFIGCTLDNYILS
jgi:hypothetical protein